MVFEECAENRAVVSGELAISKQNNIQRKAVLCSQDFKIPSYVLEKTRDPQKRIILALELDETLLYARSLEKPQHKHYFPLRIMNKLLFVQLRPHLQQFLSAVSTIFQVVIYTQNMPRYTSNIIRKIDKNGNYISHQFFRDCCVEKERRYFKDIRVIINEMKKKGVHNRQYMLVDSNPQNHEINLPNHIQVSPFRGSQKDAELKKLFELLLHLYTAND